MPGKNIQDFIALRKDLFAKFARLSEISATAKEENRDLSRRERAEIAQIKHDAEALQGRVDAARGGRFEPRAAQGTPSGEADSPPVVLGPKDRMTDYVREHRSHTFSSSGMFDELTDPSRFSLGLTVRGMLTGNWQGAELERRSLSEGVNASGGFLTPEILGSTLIDRIRNAMKVQAAGLTVVPMNFDTLYLGRLDSNSGVSWKTEGSPITASDLTFSRVTFNAKTLPILVQLSRELFEDLSSEAASLIERELVQAIALELDRTLLRGSGVAPVPLGLVGQSGVTLTSLGASGRTPVWDDVVDAVSTCRNANVDPSAVLWNSRTAQTLGKVKESTGAYIQPPPVIDGIPRLSTNQIPTNLTVGSSSDCSEIYVGDFSMLMLGLRNNVGFALASSEVGGNGFGTRIKVLEERYADTLSVGLLTYIRGDVQVAHAAGFDIVTGVRP
ncbi:MAG: phage major capsid protein [Gaiellaceae bacterium]